MYQGRKQNKSLNYMETYRQIMIQNWTFMKYKTSKVCLLVSSTPSCYRWKYTLRFVLPAVWSSILGYLHGYFRLTTELLTVFIITLWLIHLLYIGHCITELRYLYSYFRASVAQPQTQLHLWMHGIYSKVCSQHAECKSLQPFGQSFWDFENLRFWISTLNWANQSCNAKMVHKYVTNI